MFLGARASAVPVLVCMSVTAHVALSKTCAFGHVNAYIYVGVWVYFLRPLYVHGPLAVVSSQLCCLCQKEKGKLCLCRVVELEGVE